MNIPKTFIDNLNDNEVVKLLDRYKENSIEYKLIKRISNLLDRERSMYTDVVIKLKVDVNKLIYENEELQEEKNEYIKTINRLCFENKQLRKET